MLAKNLGKVYWNLAPSRSSDEHSIWKSEWKKKQNVINSGTIRSPSPVSTPREIWGADCGWRAGGDELSRSGLQLFRTTAATGALGYPRY